jgi:purine nucleosidase
MIIGKAALVFCLMGVASAMYQPKHPKRSYWLDTDIGGDVDDLFALNMLVSSPKVHLVGISTVNNAPHEKARLAKLALNHLSVQLEQPRIAEIPIYVGIGKEYETNEEFLAQNPGWPKSKFGVLNPTEQWPRQMYALQGKAFGSQLDTVEPDTETVPEMVNAFMEAVSNAAQYDSKVIVVSIGPLNNIAAILKKHPEAANNIEIWHMGGWFTKEDGSVLRSGYNSGIAPQATQAVIDSGTFIKIVTSGIVQDTNIEISKEEWKSLVEVNELDSVWSKSLKEDWQNWAGAFDRIHFADVLTAYLAINTDLVTKWDKYDVSYVVHEHHSGYGGIGFMNADPPIVTAEKNENGMVHVVSDYSNSAKALEEILAVVNQVLQQE